MTCPKTEKAFKQFIEKFQPNTTWKKLTLYTIADGVKLKENETVEEGCYWIMGFTIERNDKGIMLYTRTVEYKNEKINSIVSFSPNYDFITGKVNCFSLGWVNDEGDDYHYPLLTRLIKKFKKIDWDVVV